MQTSKSAFALCTAAVLLVWLVTAGAMSLRADYAPPAQPPPEFEALYAELSQELTDFETQLDSEWDGSVSQSRVAAALSAANGNKTIGLLTATSWTSITEMLDAFETMGVDLVKIDIVYPVLTPAFHDWLAANPPSALSPYTVTASNFIGTPASFYNRLADEISGRSLGLWIEYSTMFDSFTPTPPSGYFAAMRAAGIEDTRTRYYDERGAEAALIVSQLAPDYFTLVEEPTTQNDNFGYFSGGGGDPVPLNSPDDWGDLVQRLASEIAAAAPASDTLLGAGSGTWESLDYIERFAPLQQLDYIDIHMYPLQTLGLSYLQNALDRADYVHGIDPAKLLTVGEAWLYKASVAELIAGLGANDVFGRDVYSFWEPLDRQFLDVLYKTAQLKAFHAFAPFWSQYYFAYLTYGDPGLEGLTGPELIAIAGQEAAINVATVTLTGTGDKFTELIAASDGDGDGWPRAEEVLIGTLPSVACAATNTADDEDPDAWPPDFDDTQTVDIVDVLALKPVFGTPSARHDLDASGGPINIADVLAIKPVFGMSCG